MKTNAAQLGVTIELGSDPIAGLVRLPDGRETPFEGYVQLIAAVEQAHKGKPAPNRPRQETTDV